MKGVDLFADSDRVVMELGCGVGFTGVCLIRQNPSRLILTDGNEEALVNCQRNLSMNEVSLFKVRTVFESVNDKWMLEYLLNATHME